MVAYGKNAKQKRKDEKKIKLWVSPTEMKTHLKAPN